MQPKVIAQRLASHRLASQFFHQHPGLVVRRCCLPLLPRFENPSTIKINKECRRGVLVVTAIFYPYEQFKPALEASATRMLSAPVNIDHVGVSLFPSPSLKLSGVRIGEPVDGKIAELLVSSPFSLLGGAPHHIARIEVSGATFSANRVVALPVFMGVAAGNQEVIVRKVVIKRLQLALGESMSFNDLFGEIVFRQDGAIEKSTFETVDRSMLVNAQAGSQGLALSFEGRAWTPAGTPVSFASLQAKGVLQKNRLLVQNIDTTFLGGILRGNWLLDWSNGLVMAGYAQQAGCPQG